MDLVVVRVPDQVAHDQGLVGVDQRVGHVVGQDIQQHRHQPRDRIHVRLEDGLGLRLEERIPLEPGLLGRAPDLAADCFSLLQSLGGSNHRNLQLLLLRLLEPLLAIVGSHHHLRLHKRNSPPVRERDEELRDSQSCKIQELVRLEVQGHQAHGSVNELQQALHLHRETGVHLVGSRGGESGEHGRRLGILQDLRLGGLRLPPLPLALVENHQRARVGLAGKSLGLGRPGLHGHNGEELPGVLGNIVRGPERMHGLAVPRGQQT